MQNTFPSLPYVFTLLWYYLRCGILTPIAYLCNKSFLIHHPNRIFPSVIAPPRNNSIHSLSPTPEMYNYVTTHSSPPPPLRRWMDPQQLTQALSRDPPLHRAIILDGDLSGPPLRQGLLIIQNGNIVYIQEELGRWPSRDNYITTSAVSLSRLNSFRLFLPVHQVDRYGIRDDSPMSPFSNPLPLTLIIQEAERLKNLSLSSSSNA